MRCAEAVAQGLERGGAAFGGDGGAVEVAEVEVGERAEDGDAGGLGEGQCGVGVLEEHELFAGGLVCECDRLGSVLRVRVGRDAVVFAGVAVEFAGADEEVEPVAH